MGLLITKCHICGRETRYSTISSAGTIVIRNDTCIDCKASKIDRRLDSMLDSMHYERMPYTPKDYWNDFTTFLAYWIARICTSCTSFLTGRK